MPSAPVSMTHIEHCCAPIRRNDWRKARSRLARYLTLGALDPTEAAFAIAAARAALNPRDYHAGAQAPAFFSLILDSGALQGVRLESLSPNPLESLLKEVELPSLGSTGAQLWARLAIRLASESPAPKSATARAELFSLFARFPHANALRDALAAGAVSLPSQKIIAAVARDALALPEAGEPPRAYEAILRAGLPAPALSPRDAASFLLPCCSANAGARVVADLLRQADPGALSSRLLFEMTQAFVAKAPAQASALGAALRSSAWDPIDRSRAALMVCESSIAQRRPHLFYLAARFCSWGRLSDRAARAFGPQFIPRFEELALQAAALSPAPDPERGAPRPRL